jgi:hypothetical protein
MVGDGMNDAPALASAYASLSPIIASGITQAAADALFLGDRLAPVAAAVDIARHAKSLMRQNLWRDGLGAARPSPWAPALASQAPRLVLGGSLRDNSPVFASAPFG